MKHPPEKQSKNQPNHDSDTSFESVSFNNNEQFSSDDSTFEQIERFIGENSNYIFDNYFPELSEEKSNDGIHPADIDILDNSIEKDDSIAIKNEEQFFNQNERIDFTKVRVSKIMVFQGFDECRGTLKPLFHYSKLLLIFLRSAISSFFKNEHTMFQTSFVEITVSNFVSAQLSSISPKVQCTATHGKPKIFITKFKTILPCLCIKSFVRKQPWSGYLLVVVTIAIAR